MHNRSQNPEGTRTGGFDLLRLFFAFLVILAHSPELIDGNRNRELLARITSPDLSFGTVAVDGFFLLSGYLITQSWLRKPVFLIFFSKRARRILPGYAVAYVLSLLLVGLLASGVPHFFAALVHGKTVFLRPLVLRDPASPPVLAGMPYPYPNGPMWTIAYEFRCYMLVAVLGVLGVFQSSRLLLGITAILLMVSASFALQSHLIWPQDAYGIAVSLTGEPARFFRLTPIFLCGCCFYVFRDRIPYRGSLAAIAAVLIVAVTAVRPEHLNSLAPCGGYLLFYAARSAWFQRLRSPLPDISYGVYLYAWPIESVWLYHMHGSPWVACAITVVLSAVAGWISWTWVESRFLTRNQRVRHGAAAHLVRQHEQFKLGASGHSELHGQAGEDVAFREDAAPR